MGPVQTLATILYGFSALMSVYYMWMIYKHGDAKRNILRMLYSAFLFVSFVLRVVYFSYFDMQLTVSGHACINVGFMTLICAKVLALCVWHETGLAFTARKESYSTERRRFRILMTIYLVSVAVEGVALTLWTYILADWDGNVSLTDPDKLTQIDITIYWLGIHNLFVSVTTTLYGTRLYLRTRSHAFQGNTTLKTLKQLSSGAAVISVTFAARGVLDFMISSSPAFEEVCLVKAFTLCVGSIFLMTEWAPNAYFQILLFLLAHQRQARKREENLSRCVGGGSLQMADTPPILPHQQKQKQQLLQHTSMPVSFAKTMEVPLMEREPSQRQLEKDTYLLPVKTEAVLSPIPASTL